MIFDVDRYVLAGMRGEEIPLEEEIDVIAYNVGRRLAGKENLPCMTSVPQDGAASKLESEHPANFKADSLPSK